MAPEPPAIVWTEEAFRNLQRLSPDIREQTLLKLEVVRRFPRMYQVQGTGRWRGLRRFLVANQKVYYTYWKENHTLYVEALWPARADDRD